MRTLCCTALAALAVLAAAGTANAADECRGLLVCLPNAGPWVVVPADTGRVEYVLPCARPNYIVAGTDVRLSHRLIDVSIRGETGSPVGPGVTTTESALFVGLYAGAGERAVAFRPYVGCLPAAGGGSRSRTSRRQADPGLKPTRPVERRVVETKIAGRTATGTAQCGQGSRLVAAAHAVAFRVNSPPSDDVVNGVATVASVTAGVVRVSVRLTLAAAASKPELQVQAVCTRSGP